MNQFLAQLIATIHLAIFGVFQPILPTTVANEPIVGGLVHNVQEVFVAGLAAEDDVVVRADLQVTGTSTQATTTISSLTATNAVLSNVTISGGCTGCGGGEGGGGSYSGTTFVASTTANFDFGTLATTNCDQGSVTVTSTLEGDYVRLGLPASFFVWSGYQYEGYVSATDTVMVRRCNNRTSTGSDLVPGNIKIDVRR